MALVLSLRTRRNPNQPSSFYHAARETVCHWLTPVLAGSRLIWHWLGYTEREAVWSVASGLRALYTGAEVCGCSVPGSGSGSDQYQVVSVFSGWWPPSQNLQCYNPLSTDTRRQGRRPDQSFSETFLSICYLLSSPGPKPLAPKPQNPKPRGLGLTLKSYRPPPPHPITFKHDGGVPQKNSKSKKVSEWSPLLVLRWTARGRT